MKGKTKTQKGITLIALIITIVVLLILAAVAISSITNDNILGYAQNAAKDYNQAVKNEQEMLQEYVNFLNGNGNGNGSGGETTQTVATVKNTVLSTTSNTDVYDEYGNKIVVPAGFKIRVDDTTNNADTVTEGIVIEHGTDGNQFVWIPVGKIYTDTAKTESLAKTITLGRYDFNSTTGEPSAYSGSYTEDTEASHNPSYGNAIARNIENFITSANQKGGYYIGRYEAGNVSDTLVCKAGQTVYGDITQPDASEACKNMYNNGADGYLSGTFSSDLINSYAWDTAIVFIQTFSTETDKSNYANLNKSTSFTTTGENGDEYCNINDMSGNAFEWTTETSIDTINPCVIRGGHFYASLGYAGHYTRSRNPLSTTYGSSGYAFRPLLYVGL